MVDRLLYTTYHRTLYAEAEAIAQRSMVKLNSKNVYMVYTETVSRSLPEMVCMAKYLCQTCNRIVIFTNQDEFTNLVIAKSANIPYLYVNEIMEKINHDYRGEYIGDQYIAQATFYQHHIMPDLVDKAVEAVIVAMPHYL